MNIEDLQVGQEIQVDYWYRDKNDLCDTATVIGVITDILLCYNRVYIDVKDVLLGYCNKKSISIKFDKKTVSTINTNNHE